MGPYIFLTLVTYVIAFFVMHASNFERQRKNRIVVYTFFVILAVILCCRNISVGRDLISYKRRFFDVFQNIDFKSAFTYIDDEYLFYFLIWVVAHTTGKFQHVLWIVAIFFTFIPLSILYKQEVNHPVLAVALFLGVCPFAIYFSGLSQVTAMAFSVPAYYCCKKNKKVWFIGVVILATLFHQSALIMLIMYPLYKMRFTKRMILIISVVIGATFIFKKPLFALVLLFSGKYRMYSATENTNSYAMLILFILLLIFSYVFVPINIEKEDDDFVRLRNFLILIVIIQCFAPIHHLVMRLNYYFLMYVPVLISKTIDRTDIRYCRIVKMSGLMMIVFFSTYFLMRGINADQLDITPYIPFWS